MRVSHSLLMVFLVSLLAVPAHAAKLGAGSRVGGNHEVERIIAQLRQQVRHLTQELAASEVRVQQQAAQLAASLQPLRTFDDSLEGCQQKLLECDTSLKGCQQKLLECVPSDTCPDGEWAALCCPTGDAFCPGPGCVDLATDLENCGECGLSCKWPLSCSGGVCEATCVPSCNGPCGGDDGCGGTCVCGASLPTGINYAFVSQLIDNSTYAFDVAIVPPAGTTITTPIMTPVLTSGLPIDMALETTLSGSARSTQLYVVDAQNKQLLRFDPARCTPANVATASLGAIDLTTAPMYTNANSILGWILPLMTPVLKQVQHPIGVATDNSKVYVPSFVNTVVVTNGIPNKGLMDVDLSGTTSNNLLGLVDNYPIALGAFRACAAGQYVFVSNTLTNSVSVIDSVGTATSQADQVVATVSVGSFPTGLAFDGIDTVWVTCTIDGTVVPIVINQGTFSVGAPVTAGVGPVDIVKGTQVSGDAELTHMYVTNFFSGDISYFDPLNPPAPGVPAQTIAVSTQPSLMNKLGLSQSQMQQRLAQMFATFGKGVVGGLSQNTSALSRLFNLSSIFDLLFGATNSTSSAGIIPGILSQFLNSFHQQLGGTGERLPTSGLWGIGFARFENGTAGHNYRLVVADGTTSEVFLVDPITQTPVGSVTPSGGLFDGSSNGTIKFIPPAVSSVEIFDTTP